MYNYFFLSNLFLMQHNNNNNNNNNNKSYSKRILGRFGKQVELIGYGFNVIRILKNKM